jgi:hypothetical protein
MEESLVVEKRVDVENTDTKNQSEEEVEEISVKKTPSEVEHFSEVEHVSEVEHLSEETKGEGEDDGEDDPLSPQKIKAAEESLFVVIEKRAPPIAHAEEEEDDDDVHHAYRGQWAAQVQIQQSNPLMPDQARLQLNFAPSSNHVLWRTLGFFMVMTCIVGIFSIAWLLIKCGGFLETPEGTILTPITKYESSSYNTKAFVHGKLGRRDTKKGTKDT